MNAQPMQTGARIGPYEVLGKLGEGGMGEVYRARDTKLNRDVAIKVLPEIFTHDPDRLARFTREAQILAALNHTNIAHVHGLEALPNQASALVMELVEGEDLSAMLARGPLPFDDALAIARQMADALEAAHEQGIVHRDLKPANVKVRADGRVKVLDFGLAKMADPAVASADAMQSPTLTARATQMGLIIGTAAYMAPEQARGRAVDRRADIWSFGVVLYEMLTGRRAFEGDDISITLANVLKEDVRWDALPGDLPAPLRTLLRRCLEKDPQRRLSWIGEARLIIEDRASGVSTAPGVAAATPRASSLTWKVAAVLLAITTVAGGAAWYRARAVRPAPARFTLTPPDNMKFASGAAGRPAAVPVISPDGRSLAFAAQDESGKRMLWIRAIDSLTAHAVAGTDGAGWPFWSPDSGSIGYSAGGNLMRIAAAGGPPAVLCALPPNISARGGAWNRDGVIVFSNGPGPLHRVSSAGGASTPLGSLAAGESVWQFPHFLPDGRHVLYYVSGSPDISGVYVRSLDSSTSKRILSSDTGAIYDARNGYLLFGRQGSLMAQAFDAKTLVLSGDAFPVAEHLESMVVPGVVAFSVSDTGVLAYGTGASADESSVLEWLDRQGKPLGTLGPPANYRGIDLSPDGTKVAAHRHDGNGGDIWIVDVARGTGSKFTFNAREENASPVWSPDGRRIAYSSIRSGKAGTYVKNADGTGEEIRVFEIEASPAGMGPQPESWAADGRSLVFGMLNGPATLYDLWRLSTSGDGKATPLLTGPVRERHGQLSPDGRWIAYASTGTGNTEIYVQPSTLSGGKWAVPAAGGAVPRWRGDSAELFYMTRGSIMAVDVRPSGSALNPGTPRPLFDGTVDTGIFSVSHSDYFPYAVTKDGQRFLISRPVSSASAAPPLIVVVLNWIEGNGR